MKTYDDMYEAYSAIFRRCGLHTCVPVEADTGVMGGMKSHEFTVLAPSGEDKVVQCASCGYAANAELALRVPRPAGAKQGSGMLRKVHTPGLKSIDELTGFFKCGADSFIKTLIYTASGETVAVLVRGDLDVNEVKLAKHLKASDLAMADAKTIQDATGAPVGFSGPAGLLGTKVIADISVKGARGCVCGANQADYHLCGVDEGRDFTPSEWADVASAQEGDSCVRCSGVLSVKNGIEVGQVFSLGTKYSNKMGAVYADAAGALKACVMGCYGIGVSRTAQACVELNCDEKGILWPMEIAPYKAVVMPLNMKSETVKGLAEKVYGALDCGDTLLDDRDDRAGVKFNDADLIGFPIRIIIGDKNAANGNVEFSLRKDGAKEVMSVEAAIQKARDLMG